MKDLVLLKKKDVFTTSEIIASGVNVQHKVITNLLRKHKNDFLEFGELKSILKMLTHEKKKRQRTTVFELNEGQSLLLFTYLKNTPIAREFKKHLVRQFLTMRKFILNLENIDRAEIRAEGKIIRRLESDTIKQFVDYATKQGSKSAFRYYSNITKMENAALFNLAAKFDNVRELLDTFQLSDILKADQIVNKYLLEGMENQMYYKDIYKLAKENVLKYGNIMGKTSVPNIKALN